MGGDGSRVPKGVFGVGPSTYGRTPIPPTMRVVACTLAMLFVLFSAPVYGQPVGATKLGVDAAEDDREAAGSLDDPTGLAQSTILPAPGADQADIDDVLGLSISATSEDVVFRVDVAESPSDSERLLGTFCWVAAFQVGSAADEYLALGCTTYDSTGTGTDNLEKSSVRGTNVIKSMAWAEDGPAMLLTVSRADIGAGPGATLTDIYALTYMGSSLSVDDAAPDAKSDRDSTESFGSYGLDSGETGNYLGEPQYSHVYQNVTGSTFNVTLQFVPEDWVQYHYNWTSPHNSVRFYCQESDGAPLWTWSIRVRGAHDGGPGVASLGQSSGCNDPQALKGTNVGFKGPLDIVISLRKGNGTFSAQIEPGPDTGPSATSNPSGTTGASSSGTREQDTDNPTSREAPGISLAILIGLLVSSVLPRRRRA